MDLKPFRVLLSVDKNVFNIWVVFQLDLLRNGDKPVKLNLRCLLSFYLFRRSSCYTIQTIRIQQWNLFNFLVLFVNIICLIRTFF